MVSGNFLRIAKVRTTFWFACFSAFVGEYGLCRSETAPARRGGARGPGRDSIGET